MNDAQRPEIEVRTLMDRLRSEYAAIAAEVAKSARSPSVTERGIPRYETLAMTLPRLPEGSNEFVVKEQYHLNDFLRFHDEDFVRNAYVGLLRRDPDPTGFDGYLEALRTGRLAKTDIAGRLRYSAEGRAAGVSVHGLMLPFALRTARRAPILGRLLGIVQYVLRLPDLVRNHERLEAVVAHQRLETHRKLNAVEAAIEDVFARFNQQVAERVDALEAVSIRRYKQNAARNLQLETAFTAESERLQRWTADRWDALDAELDRTLARLTNSISTSERLREEFARAVEAFAGRVDLIASESDAKLAAMASELEFKADSSQLTMLANGLVELVQRKAERDDLVNAKLDADGRLRALTDELGKLESGKAERLQLERFREDSELRMREILAVLDVLGKEKADQRELLEVAAAARAIAVSKADSAQIETALKALDQRVLTLATQHRKWRRELGPKVEVVSETSHAGGAGRNLDGETAAGPLALDRMYVDFEDRFRGSKEEIRNRVAVYLPIVGAMGAGSAGAPILDIGCGRGEWMELLRDNGLVARGVDINPITVKSCRDAGLDVTEGDALDYLADIDNGSVGAVTGMHVVEHLPFERLVVLIDEAFRVLQPGGIAIFETPNPENINVGACAFYMDPTHQRPLPPETLRFVVEARGFTDVELRRLHPYPTDAQVKEGHPAIAAFINGMFFGPRDYAVIGRKP